VEGIVKEEKAEKVDDGEKKKKTVKVLRKIPPKVMKEAKGIVIFTAMRSGIAPFGGAGGTGLVLARLPDGCKSHPSLMYRTRTHADNQPGQLQHRYHQTTSPRVY
jgi:lipid-binding SYLF domain-containing protein